MHNVHGQNILTRFVDEIFLLEFLHHIMFIINVERIELVGHKFWFLMERN